MKAEQLFDVRGHAAIVTGAASGLGLAMAEVLADNGAALTMIDVDAAALENHAARLKRSGADVIAEALDVRDTARLRKAIDDTAAKRGRLDIVFANAGISAGPGYKTPVGNLTAVDLAAWQNVLDINLTSVFVTVQSAAQHMKARNYGRIVVTSSIAGMRSEVICGYAYVATKAAVANVVRHAAAELAPHNITVNAIAPGTFFTNIGNGRLRDPAVAKDVAALSPMNRLAAPEEMKGLALLLASPASSYITGAVIPIDGGATAA
jgi:NAD(P)-dependent dehydrogenase (short-subunit alcohol dehydrogenase family)